MTGWAWGRTRSFLNFGCGMVDADLDGDLDVVFANGHVQDTVAAIDPSASYAQRPRLFRSTAGRFEDVTGQAGPVFQ